MQILLQILTVTKFALRTIPQRLGSSATAMFGIAGVVGVLTGVLSIAEGFRAAMTNSGSLDNVIVLRSGSDTEMMSGLTREEARIIADAPGIGRSTQWVMSSAELFVVINLPARSTGTDANVPLRGIEYSGFVVREGLEIVEGRRFTPGRNEVIVGVGAARQFAGLEVGSKIKLGALEWDVVGMFTGGGGSSDSEIWTDARALQSAYRRNDTFQSVHVRLASEDDETFNQFKDALTADPRLDVKVERLMDFQKQQSEGVYMLITMLGIPISIMMAIGAIFGALNTMYSAVSARTKEIATLRALGFGGFPAMASVMIESMTLAVIGGATGAGLAYLAFDGYQTATMNWQTFSQVAFAFAVTPPVLIAGVAYAVAIGLVGGFFPALRAARIPVAHALREQ